MRHSLAHLSMLAIPLTLMLLLLPALSRAATHVGEMRNAAADDPNEINLFTPALLEIAPGDTVRFVAVDPGHNGASKRGMLPEGAEPWNGGIDEEPERTFDVEGIYGYVCVPHYEMGMIGLILVGDHTVNLEAAREVRHVGKARQAFRALFERIDERPVPISRYRARRHRPGSCTRTKRRACAC